MNSSTVASSVSCSEMSAALGSEKLRTAASTTWGGGLGGGGSGGLGGGGSGGGFGSGRGHGGYGNSEAGDGCELATLLGLPANAVHDLAVVTVVVRDVEIEAMSCEDEDEEEEEEEEEDMGRVWNIHKILHLLNSMNF